MLHRSVGRTEEKQSYGQHSRVILMHEEAQNGPLEGMRSFPWFSEPVMSRDTTLSARRLQDDASRPKRPAQTTKIYPQVQRSPWKRVTGTNFPDLFYGPQGAISLLGEHSETKPGTTHPTSQAALANAEA